MSTAALTPDISPTRGALPSFPDQGAGLGDGIQMSLDEIGEPLSSTTFVVVDLETTGGSPTTSAITEIGAVKTRGGEVIGEFQTLVDPGGPIPPFIVALTSITDAMVASAPRIEAVLPAFLEFLSDGVLVAHNARFDVGFLKAACNEHGYAWPGNEVVDTLTLARRATTQEEAPNKKLGTLARLFGSTVEPNHRALEDARATSQVLHGLLSRLAAWGITHREDLDSLRNPVPEKLRRKASMSDAVPSKPGVYVFRGPRGEHLYVGTSKNLRSRVKSYFTRGEQRRKIRDMLEIAVSVDTYVCATAIEASVIEVRMINQYRPRFNHRSTRPERTVWLTLTNERFPRLSISRSADGKGAALGPIRGGSDARLALESLTHTLRLRSCTTRLTVVPRPGARACLLKDMGACDAPCVNGEASGYDDVVGAARHALQHDPSPVIAALALAVARHSEALEYERAGQLRDAASTVVEAGIRAESLAALARIRLVATRRSGDAWELVAVAHGRLTGSSRVATGVWDAADALEATWADQADQPTTLIEEQELLARWLEQPGTRLLHINGEWAQPLASAGPHHGWVTARRTDHERVVDAARGTSHLY